MCSYYKSDRSTGMANSISSGNEICSTKVGIRTITRRSSHVCRSSITAFSNSNRTCLCLTTSRTSRIISNNVLTLVVPAPTAGRGVICSSRNPSPYRGSVRSIRVCTTRCNSPQRCRLKRFEKYQKLLHYIVNSTAVCTFVIRFFPLLRYLVFFAPLVADGVQILANRNETYIFKA